MLQSTFYEESKQKRFLICIKKANIVTERFPIKKEYFIVFHSFIYICCFEKIIT